MPLAAGFLEHGPRNRAGTGRSGLLPGGAQLFAEGVGSRRQPIEFVVAGSIRQRAARATVENAVAVRVFRVEEHSPPGERQFVEILLPVAVSVPVDGSFNGCKFEVAEIESGDSLTGAHGYRLCAGRRRDRADITRLHELVQLVGSRRDQWNIARVDIR